MSGFRSNETAGISAATHNGSGRVVVISSPRLRKNRHKEPEQPVVREEEEGGGCF